MTPAEATSAEEPVQRTRVDMRPAAARQCLIAAGLNNGQADTVLQWIYGPQFAAMREIERVRNGGEPLANNRFTVDYDDNEVLRARRASITLDYGSNVCHVELTERLSLQKEDSPTEADISNGSAASIESTLAQVAKTVRTIKDAQAELKTQVQEARDLGATWAAIGAAAEIAPQSAYQKWSEKGRLKHADYQRRRYAKGISHEDEQD